jgi:hypothetical protein
MVYGKPERSSQSFEFRCVWKSFKEVLDGKIGDVLTTNSDGKVDFFELPRKHSGARTHLKMIDQPSGVLEYDAVGAINDKFREAVSYNMYERIVLRLYGMWHLPREVKRAYGHPTPKHIHDLHWQI